MIHVNLYGKAYGNTMKKIPIHVPGFLFMFIVSFFIRLLGKQVIKGMLRSLAVGLGILSVLDGVSIALDIWDPAGFALVPTNKDIKTMRDAYIYSNKSQLDNKMWNSEFERENTVQVSAL